MVERPYLIFYDLRLMADLHIMEVILNLVNILLMYHLTVL